MDMINYRDTNVNDSMIGKKFGMLTVIERAPSQGHNRFWLCRCDCGNVVAARNDKLLSGKKTHCGCLREAKKTISPGDRFGHLVAVQQQGDMWLCDCDCGKEGLINAKKLQYGLVKTCGCKNTQLRHRQLMQEAGHKTNDWDDYRW